MPFGMVSGVGQGICALDGGGDRRRKGAVLGVNFGHPIVTNGEFVALLCESDALFSNYSEDLLLQLCMTRLQSYYGPLLRLQRPASLSHSNSLFVQ